MVGQLFQVVGTETIMIACINLGQFSVLKVSNHFTSRSSQHFFQQMAFNIQQFLDQYIVKPNDVCLLWQ